MMGGWKTWLGAIAIGGGFAMLFFGYEGAAVALWGIGGTMLPVGLGHKIEKAMQAYVEAQKKK